MLAQASALQRQGQIVEAEHLYRAVLAIAPDNADALHSMGNLKLARGEPGEALRLIGAAMAARAPTPRILFDLGLAFNALNQHQKALDSFDLAIQLQPDFFEAHGNRGAMLAALGRHGDAIESYRKALAIRPDFADAHCNLGSTLTQLQRYDEALASLDRALALRADYPDALYNRGNALKPLQRYEEALASYDRAIALQPNHADAHNNRGQVLRELERYDEALASYDRALALRPQHVMAHCNAAALRLLTGDFERGWAHYEWRWLKKSVVPTKRNFSQPAWDGRDPIAGKTILIHSEQGLGDTIQFCRYVPLLAARGAQVIFEVQKPLQTLMASLGGAAQVVAKGSPFPLSICIVRWSVFHSRSERGFRQFLRPLDICPRRRSMRRRGNRAWRENRIRGSAWSGRAIPGTKGTGKDRSVCVPSCHWWMPLVTMSPLSACRRTFAPTTTPFSRSAPTFLITETHLQIFPIPRR